MKFTVKRSDWLRGPEAWDGARNEENSPNNISCLINAEGKKCCLGFLALACGYTEAELHGNPCLSDLAALGNVKYPAALRDYDKDHNFIEDSSECDAIMDDNDDVDISDEQRERYLKQKFSKIKIAINFED